MERYCNAVASAVEDVFGTRLVGVWLIGSHSYGGATIESDIDIQAAVSDPTAPEVQDLADRIAHPRLECPGAGLEFVLYDVADLNSPKAPLQWRLNLNGGPTRAHKRSTDPGTESWHWFVLDLVGGRLHAHTLAGRQLGDVVGPIDRQVQLEAIAESYRWHRDSEPSGLNQTANAARSLMYLRTDRWGCKAEGIEWAATVNLRSPESILQALSLALEAEGVDSR